MKNQKLPPESHPLSQLTSSCTGSTGLNDDFSPYPCIYWRPPYATFKFKFHSNLNKHDFLFITKNQLQFRLDVTLTYLICPPLPRDGQRRAITHSPNTAGEHRRASPHNGSRRHFVRRTIIRQWIQLSWQRNIWLLKKYEISIERDPRRSSKTYPLQQQTAQSHAPRRAEPNPL